MSDNYKKINKSQVAVLKALARISIDEALGGANTVSYELLSPICAVEFYVQFLGKLKPIENSLIGSFSLYNSEFCEK